MGGDVLIDNEKWLNSFVSEAENLFGNRIEFIGLQGSYARKEATDSSNIDIVLILDKLDASDLKKFDTAVSKLPYRELLCGFVSGKEELLNWARYDLFQFYFDTVPIKGSIDYIKEFIDEEAVDNAILTGACNIYHMCVHNILHEKDIEILKSLYKGAAFVIQAIYYKQSGEYIKQKSDMITKARPEEKHILENFEKLKNNDKNCILMSFLKHYLHGAVSLLNSNYNFKSRRNTIYGNS